MIKEDVIEILERFVIGAKPCSQREIVDACASAYRMLKEQPPLLFNLDEAAEEWCKRNNKGIALCADGKSHYLADGMDAFKACAEWMARQGVTKEAIIGMATKDIFINVSGRTLDELGLCPGDKVVVQIRKK